MSLTKLLPEIKFHAVSQHEEYYVRHNEGVLKI